MPPEGVLLYHPEVTGAEPRQGAPIWSAQAPLSSPVQTGPGQSARATCKACLHLPGKNTHNSLEERQQGYFHRRPVALSGDPELCQGHV